MAVTLKKSANSTHPPSTRLIKRMPNSARTSASSSKLHSPTIQMPNPTVQSPLSMGVRATIEPQFLENGTSTFIKQVQPQIASRESSAGDDRDSAEALRPVVNDMYDFQEVVSKLETRVREFEEDHNDWMTNWLAKARTAIEEQPSKASVTVKSRTHPANHVVSPFHHLQKTSRSSKLAENYSFTSANSNYTRERQLQIQTYPSKQRKVPYYSHHTSVEHNIPAENNKTLRVYPQITDPNCTEATMEQQEHDLRRFFGGAIPESRHSDLRKRTRTNLLRPYLFNFLADVGIKIDDIFQYLLDQKMFKIRFPMEVRALSKPTALLASYVCKAMTETCKLSISETIRELMDAAYQDLIADEQDTEPVKTSVGLNETPDDAAPLPTRFAFCRICFVSECPLHGEYPEGPPSDDDDAEQPPKEKAMPRTELTVSPRSRSLRGLVYTETFATSLDFGTGLDDDGNLSNADSIGTSIDNRIFSRDETCSDLCFWKKSNRTVVAPRPWSTSELIELEEFLIVYANNIRGPCMIALYMKRSCIEIFHEAGRILKDQASDTEAAKEPSKLETSRKHTEGRSQYIQKWLQTRTHDMRERPHSFIPCSHEGTCEEAGCSCFENVVHCEKYCQCDDDCRRRYRGCTCRSTGTVCFFNEKCPCYRLGRECDPDLCGNCGAKDKLDPLKKRDLAITSTGCGNVGIQANVPKRTILGSSEIAGFGLFVGEAVKANEYLGEYKGEIISYPEGARRGAAYHFQRVNYLFGLTFEGQEAL